MHGLEMDGVNVFQNFACGLQGSLPLVSGLCWERSSAATCHNLRCLPGSRCLLWRHFCSLRLSFQSCSTRLASHCRLNVSTVKGSTRSETMFQWSLEGGLRFIAILGPCIRPWGNFSGSYSSMDVVASPRKREKVT